MERFLFYESSNGDQWFLLSAEDPPMVEHQPNEPSGGKTSRTSVFEFLKPTNSGAEYQELRKILKKLAQRSEENVRR